MDSRDSDEARDGDERKDAHPLARLRPLWLPVTFAVGLGVALLCVEPRFYHGDPPSPIRTARTAVRQVHPIAELWMIEHDGGCPTLERLVADHQIGSSPRLEDPWGHGYEIRCDDDAIVCESAGPDGRLGTADDIVFPDHRER